VVADVLAPFVAGGAIARRPRVVGLLDRLDADRRAVRRLQRVRDGFGTGPVLLGVPGREIALVLSPGDVRRVLDGSPEPFTPASREKRAALSHFQPHGVLISRGAERADRRRFTEGVLDTARPVHRHAAELVRVVHEEASAMIATAERSGALGWDGFPVPWWRMARRAMLGEGARDDDALTDLLTELRRDANWAYLKPRRARLRERFFARLRAHLARAEPGSLAALVAAERASPVTAAAHQVPQWLFAFDAAGMAAFRALALLDAHPDRLRRARGELAGADLSVPQELPFLRACVLESVRLWPTTPAVLRDTTAETAWASGTLPRGTALVIFAPFFHRDGTRLPQADTFAPELWLDGRAHGEWPLIPFSAGPAECPGRNLVLLLCSTLLASLLCGPPLRRAGGAALEPGALPATLSPFRLRFEPAG
jgi:cytochrome P450